MTNFQIIANHAIANGIYSEDEVMDLFERTGGLPLHTFAGWKSRGYKVKKGEHAVMKCDIWLHKNKKSQVETENGTEEVDESRFYKKSSHFFSEKQVEKIN